MKKNKDKFSPPTLPNYINKTAEDFISAAKYHSTEDIAPKETEEETIAFQIRVPKSFNDEMTQLAKLQGLSKNALLLSYLNMHREEIRDKITNLKSR